MVRPVYWGEHSFKSDSKAQDRLWSLFKPM
jgi:hypothetical protein